MGVACFTLTVGVVTVAQLLCFPTDPGFMVLVHVSAVESLWHDSEEAGTT